jgi:hypothetical protein
VAYQGTDDGEHRTFPGALLDAPGANLAFRH